MDNMSAAQQRNGEAFWKCMALWLRAVCLHEARASWTPRVMAWFGVTGNRVWSMWVGISWLAGLKKWQFNCLASIVLDAAAAAGEGNAAS
jgi:hypothetical protein